MTSHKSGYRYKETKKKKKKAQKEINRYKSHPLYSNIPLIEVKYIDINGKERTYWDYDLNYEPKLPSKAVVGDVRKQVFCHMCHFPKYFYVDIEQKCIQCGNEFIFSAKEQKFWYETLKFNFHSSAIRCIPCRKKQRNDKAIKAQLDYSTDRVKKESNDPLTLLALVEAIIQYYDRFHEGNLSHAISICRKAFRISPRLYECLYWEAVCHERAERRSKAAEKYGQFIDSAKSLGRCSSLIKKAKARMDVLKNQL